MEQETGHQPDWTERLPLIVRIPIGIVGVIAIGTGLALGIFWLVAASMSTAHGGRAIPDVETAVQMLLPVTLVAFGVSSILCKSINRLAVLAVMLTLLVAHLAILAH